MATFEAKYGQIIGGPIVPVDNLRLLWENPNPTAQFPAQNIELLDEDYDFLLIMAKASGSSGTFLFSDIIPKGWDLNLSTSVSDTSKGIVVRRRNITYVSDTKYYVANGATVNSVENTTSTNNGICVPVFVYGIKKDSVEGIKGSTVKSKNISVTFSSGKVSNMASLASYNIISAELPGNPIITGANVSGGVKSGYGFTALNSNMAVDTSVTGEKTLTIYYTN